VPHASSGWREYGSTTLAGTPIDLRLRVGGNALGDTDVADRFATRAKVFSACDCERISSIWLEPRNSV
jgi:hypothetical protein